jgi:HlyD family secretion protein
MKMQNDFSNDEGGERLWTQGTPYEKYGLQGAATVLELRRIQEAFDREFSNQPSVRVVRHAKHPDGRAIQGKKRKRKESVKKQGVVGTVVSACLQGLGFGSVQRADVIDKRIERPRPYNAGSNPNMRTHRQSQNVAGRNKPPPFRSEAPQMATKDIEGELAVMLSRTAFNPDHQGESRALPVRRAETPVSPRQNDERRIVPAFEGGRNRVASSRAAVTVVNDAVESGLEKAKRGYDFLFSPPTNALAVVGQGGQLQMRVANSLENEFKTGLRVVLAGIVIFGGWATLVPLSSAVAVPGSLVAESSVKKVQHSTGGVVAQILARDGMHVKEGDLLLRLDETQTRANRQVLVAQLAQVRARLARLAAERDGASEPTFPRELTEQAKDKDIQQLLASERALFKARASSRQNQKDLLQSRIVQLEGEIAGLSGQVKSKATQIELIKEELKGVQSLFDRHLTPITRLTTLQREAARLEGEKAQMASAISEAQSKTDEAKLQIEQVDQNFRADVLKDLRESQDKEAEIAERNVAAKDQLDRVEIRAPASGVVHELAAHTLGGVVSPAEVIMEIVPDSDGLQVEARLPPNDIDHVQTGQKGMVHFSAFNQRTTPQLEGVVSYVSADLTRDKQTNAAYYTVRVSLPEEQRRRLGGLQLVSGMPAEVFLQTGSRTMMTYLLKPISDQLERSFNEQ